MLFFTISNYGSEDFPLKILDIGFTGACKLQHTGQGGYVTVESRVALDSIILDTSASGISKSLINDTITYIIPNNHSISFYAPYELPKRVGTGKCDFYFFATYIDPYTGNIASIHDALQNVPFITKDKKEFSKKKIVE